MGVQPQVIRDGPHIQNIRGKPCLPSAFRCPRGSIRSATAFGEPSRYSASGNPFSVREGGLFPCPYVECSRQVTTSSRGLHSLPVPRPGRANNYQQESETQWDENISLRYFWYGSRNPLLITTALAAIIHLPTKVYLQPPRGPQLTHVRQK